MCHMNIYHCLLHCGMCLALTACHASAHRIVTESPLQISVPSGLSGPIDPQLPQNAAIGDVRVCAGPNKQVAVVWTREARRDLLSVASQPSSTSNQTSSPGCDEESEYSAPSGEYVGMCVLAPRGAGGVSGDHPCDATRRSGDLLARTTSRDYDPGVRKGGFLGNANSRAGSDRAERRAETRIAGHGFAGGRKRFAGRKVVRNCRRTNQKATRRVRGVC